VKRFSREKEIGGRGFEILAFPCNQFGHQEWPTEEEIPVSLKYVRPGISRAYPDGYEPYFELFSKVHVNGWNTHPVFQHLRARCPSPRTDLSDTRDDIIWSPVTESDLSWNFEKFLVDHRGVVRYRYPDKWEPEEILDDIKALMNEP